MNINHEDYIELREHLEKDFSAVFRRVDECERIVGKEDERLDKLFEELSLLREGRAKDSTKLSILIGILSAIAVALLPFCLVSIFGG